jgi:hypothetical protein
LEENRSQGNQKAFVRQIWILQQREIEPELRRAKRGAFLMKHERTKRAKRIRIEWNNVSLVVDVANYICLQPIREKSIA